MPDPNDAHAEAMDYLYGRLNYERLGLPGNNVGLGLRRMRKLVRKLGDPQESLKIFHVAGSKGKGSTSTMIAAGLAAGGLKTGLFCSPHLHRLEERYLINGQQIEPDELVRQVHQVQRAVAEIDSGRAPETSLTFFGITTAIGLQYFAQQRCDAVVLEVGLGGRLDSTNIVHPLISVITSISLEHTRQLGSTTDLIAYEKAGIIKRGGYAVSGVTDIPARNRIRDVATLRRARLREVERDYQFREIRPELPLVKPENSRINVQTWLRDWGDVKVPMLGPHQAANAALALASFDAACEMGLEIRPEMVKTGWDGLSMPARVEVLGKRPWLIIDGAHNQASAVALASTLRGHFPKPVGNRVLIYGTTREKDLQGQLGQLVPEFDKIIVTRYLNNPRARPLDETCEAVRLQGGQVESVFENPVDAYEHARKLASTDGMIVITGSLFLAGELREHILKLGRHAGGHGAAAKEQ